MTYSNVNMMEGIRTWLNSSKDYDAGVALLIKYSSNAKLKRLFQVEGVSDFKKGLLEKELKGLLQTGQQVVEEKKVVQHGMAVNHSRWPGEMDAIVKSLHEQWKPLFAEMNDLQTRLYDVAVAGKTDKAKEIAAGKMAHKILDLDDACESIYARRDHYMQHGKLPEESKPADVVVDPVKMVVALKNAERYVREFKNKLKKDATNTKAAAKLKHWEGMVDYYKKELKLV